MAQGNEFSYVLSLEGGPDPEEEEKDEDQESGGGDPFDDLEGGVDGDDDSHGLSGFFGDHDDDDD